MSDHRLPELKGLILCGGKSSRMQEDKSQLEYHGAPQWEYLRALLRKEVREIWISCRKEQAGNFGDEPNLLFDDKHSGVAGPAAGLLTGHQLFPDAAWLVAACDLALVTSESITRLVRARSAGFDATAFLNRERDWPEPLLAIWEPAALKALRENASRDVHCPRKTLQQCRTFLLETDQHELFNANTPHDKAYAENSLNRGLKSGGASE